MTSLEKTLHDMEFLSDFVLVSIEGFEYRVHKGFLARVSTVFKNMFYDIRQGEQMLKVDLSSNELVDLLHCIYLPSALGLDNGTINVDNIRVLAEAARKYQIEEILRACDVLGVQKIDVNISNAAEWLEFSYEYELEEFSRKCEEAVGPASYSVLVRKMGGAEGLSRLSDKAKTKLLLAAASQLDRVNVQKNTAEDEVEELMELMELVIPLLDHIFTDCSKCRCHRKEWVQIANKLKSLRLGDDLPIPLSSN